MELRTQWSLLSVPLANLPAFPSNVGVQVFGIELDGSQNTQRLGKNLIAIPSPGMVTTVCFAMIA